MLRWTLLLALGGASAAHVQHPDLAHISFSDSAPDADPHPMKLQLLSQPDAVCLDGTPGGFYFAEAWDPANKDDWQIYFQGGGWCYDEADCWGRSKGSLGSSKSWPQFSSMGGVMSSDCSVSQDFCKFNRVHMAYCDGDSFAGDREDPVVVNGEKIYFRGKRIIDATLKQLLPLGLASAKRVLLTGCSAGGLATYLHTDYVHAWLKQNVPSLQLFKSSPISGFFLLHDNVEGKPVYGNEMQTIFNLANATGGVNQACVAAAAPGDEWKCNMAQYSYAHIQADIFPFNSALDSWQTGCILTSEPVNSPNSTKNGNCSAAPGWGACSHNPEACTSDQVDMLNKYQTDFLTDYGSATSKADGNGAFIHSCHTHCEAQGDSSWLGFKINGVSMAEAHHKWWVSTNEPAAEHTTQPCMYHKTSPHMCNPTCKA